MDQIVSLSRVRNAIVEAVSGLKAVDATDDLREFARKESERLNGLLAKIDAEIRALRGVDNAPRP